jgi:hypothetical protein
MKKLDYNGEKLQEILQALTNMQLPHVQEAEGLNITLATKTEYKQVQHLLSRVFHQYPKPPLSQQFDHSVGILTLFDPRQR